MTFRSAPHSVLPITFKILRAFKPPFNTYLRWGTKDNFLSNITPQTFGSPPLLELDFCPEKAVDLNGVLFSGRYAYRQSLSLRIKNRCQLPIAEVYSDKAAADVQ